MILGCIVVKALVGLIVSAFIVWGYLGLCFFMQADEE